MGRQEEVQTRGINPPSSRRLERRWNLNAQPTTPPHYLGTLLPAWESSVTSQRPSDRFHQKERRAEESETRFRPFPLLRLTFAPLCLISLPPLSFLLPVSPFPPLLASFPSLPQRTPATPLPLPSFSPPRPSAAARSQSVRGLPRPRPPGRSGRAGQSPGRARLWRVVPRAGADGAWQTGGGGAGLAQTRVCGPVRGRGGRCSPPGWANPGLAGPSRRRGWRAGQACRAGGRGAEIEVGAEEGAEPRRWVERRGGRRLGRGGRAERRPCPELGGGGA